MQLALASLLVAALLPLVWTVCAKAGAPYDNARPREVLARAVGYRQRANWAQQNAWEALPVWLGALFAAWVTQLPPALVDAAALLFVAGRVLHGVFYIADRPTLRSFAWLAAFASAMVLYGAALLRA